MKTRNSYVTNSSSASFILTVKSGVEDLYEFKRVMDDYLKHNVVMVDKYCPPEEYKNKSILQVITENDNKEEKLDLNTFWKRLPVTSDDICIVHKYNNIFELTAMTAMFNDYNDIPTWMKNLMVDFLRGITRKYEIEILNLEIDEDSDV